LNTEMRSQRGILLTEIMTASISGISSIVQGGATMEYIEMKTRHMCKKKEKDVRVYLFGPIYWLGLHRSLNTGSNRMRTPLVSPCEDLKSPIARDGSSTKKHACPSQVAFILSCVLFSEVSGSSPDPDWASPQVGLRTLRHWVISLVSLYIMDGYFDINFCKRKGHLLA